MIEMIVILSLILFVNFYQFFDGKRISKKCKKCDTTKNLIIDVYTHGGLFTTYIVPKTWLCNYHYRKDRNITHDDFTTFLDYKESRLGGTL